MNITVGTEEVELSTSDYPDTGLRGQSLVLQNLGPGDVFFDTRPEVTPESGVKMAPNGGYEVANWTSGASLYLVSNVADTDVRYSVVG